MRRRFPALLASLVLATVLAPAGVSLASEGPSSTAGKSTIAAGSSTLKSPSGTGTAGRRWN